MGIKKTIETNFDFQHLYEDESRKKITKMLMNLFDHWELDVDKKLKLLGLSPKSRSLLSQYSSCKKAIPAGRDSIDRAGYLLSIHKSLRLLYPENPNIRYKWISMRNKDFNNYAPVEVMLDEGIIGLAKVARYLDFRRGY